MPTQDVDLPELLGHLIEEGRDLLPVGDVELDGREDVVSVLQVNEPLPVVGMDSLNCWDRYWVLFVMPYILFTFVMNHSKETCEKLYRVRCSPLRKEVIH